MNDLKARNRREEVALFRAEIIGALLRCDLDHGELKERLRGLSRKRFRPPRSSSTRTFSIPTLERWYYAYKNGGLKALEPMRRSDRGHAHRLSKDLRALLLDIRRAHPSASAELIRDTLITDGRLDPHTLSVSTLRRLYRQEGLKRRSRRGKGHPDGRQRLRWQAAHPMALWHADVCHGPKLMMDGQKKPLRIHAIMDDASRHVVALEARHTEREEDMIHILTGALRRFGMPDALYLDNGPLYIGEALSTACARLEMGLIHAKPYDPQARGKMERFFRTLRGRCLDHLTDCTTLHDVNVRLWSFLDAFYHRRPHAGLMGKTPKKVFDGYLREHPTHLDEDRLKVGFTVRKRRRVRADSTLTHEGAIFEVDQSYLATRCVTVAHCLLDEPIKPWVEHNETTYALRPVDVIKNGSGRRKAAPVADKPDVDFDPAKTLLKKATGHLQ